VREHTIQVTAPWEGRTQIFVTGEHQAFVLGVFAGRLGVDKESNALHDARQDWTPASSCCAPGWMPTPSRRRSTASS
jgi:hypothetical protein